MSKLTIQKKDVERYLKFDRVQKKIFLDQVVAKTGAHRKSVIRSINAVINTNTIKSPARIKSMRSASEGRKPMPRGNTTVYRAFDSRGRVLYVGVAADWAKRWAAHSVESEFYPLVTRVEVEQFPTREAALVREAVLIRTLRPSYNVQGVRTLSGNAPCTGQNVSGNAQVKRQTSTTQSSYGRRGNARLPRFGNPKSDQSAPFRSGAVVPAGQDPWAKSAGTATTCAPPRENFTAETEKNPSRARVITIVGSKSKNLKPQDYNGAGARRPPRATARVNPTKPLPLSEQVAQPLIAQASEALGLSYWVKAESERGRSALKLAAKRIDEGFTADDLVRACRFAAQRWANGERFSGLRSFRYLWGSELGAVLDAGAERDRRRDAPTHRTGEDLEAWQRALKDSVVPGWVRMGIHAEPVG